MDRTLKVVSCLIILFSSPIFAHSSIQVHVKTNERTAAAVGFMVDGKKSGSRGKNHSSTGPINKTYTFGYRKHFALGHDVSCGSKILTKNTQVTLVSNGEQCFIIAE